MNCNLLQYVKYKVMQTQNNCMSKFVFYEFLSNDKASPINNKFPYEKHNVLSEHLKPLNTEQHRTQCYICSVKCLSNFVCDFQIKNYNLLNK